MMCKFKKNLIVMLLLLTLSPINSYASTVYTTDDLRVLMGMHRLSDDGSMTEIKRLLSSCYKQKEWNDLVAALGDIDDVQLKDFKEKEDAWYKAKDILETNFSSGNPIKTILNDYVNYQTAASLRVEYAESNSFKLATIDTDDIESKINYANSILEAANDNTVIGKIGHEMKTFTKASLLISIPFGSSYSIDSGKRQSNKGLTILIQQNYKIYSQFNGTVTAITDNSVTIRTGKSIEIEYSGIKPTVMNKQKIKQYAVVGKTKTENMTIKFKLNTVYVDPLLLYGSRSADWYEQWLNANPGCTIDKNDYTYLLDDLPDVVDVPTPDTNNAGTIIDKEGTASQIIIQGENSYTDTPDNLEIEKTDPGIINNKN